MSADIMLFLYSKSLQVYCKYYFLTWLQNTRVPNFLENFGSLHHFSFSSTIFFHKQFWEYYGLKSLMQKTSKREKLDSSRARNN